ncbi:CheY-like chemotaxis protein [Litorivivens lipolytica]|uniref:CheY-like chemotaxis protein n=1 Tax=Litorivivens lipolytica TaxID=1524264 RepID=A0A7W4W7X4_9GAMM|nr:response regulator [Litorivivens lipolytica]MBB3048658.1 CheY-like chemotaxis protein [Litorivivens lipolytica]
MAPGNSLDPTRRQRRPVQILLAEDSLGDVVLVRKALEAIEVPFELTVVSHGEALLSHLVDALKLDGKNSLPFPDLVLIDLNMPRLDGFKALELISQQEACRQLPLVVISSSSNPEDVTLAYELGADGFIDKALGPAGFIEQLKFIEHYWSREGLIINPGPQSRH